jgi:tetratricopeptide (TPR) repeat protein
MIKMRRSLYFLSVLFTIQLSSYAVFAQRNVDLMLGKTQQMIISEDYINAIKNCNEIIVLKPYLFEPYYFRGVSKFYLEDFKGAESDLSKAIEIKPNSPHAYHYRALTRERIFDFDGSLQDFEEAIRQSPYDPQLYINRAITFLYLKQYYDAIGNCNIAIRLDPDMENTYMIRGAAKTGLDDFIGALEDYNKAIKLNKFNDNAYLRRGMVRFELEDSHGALIDFNEAIRLNPANSFAYFNRSFVYLKESNYDSALSDLNKVLEIDPTNSLTYFYRGMTYTELEEIDKAIADYSMVLSISPNNLMVYFNRGNLYMQKKQYKNAVKDYTEAITIYPDMADAYANRAIARSQLKQNELATQDYDIARKLKEEHYEKTHEEMVAEEEKIQSLMDFEAQFFQSEKEKEQLQNKDIDIDLLNDYSIVWNFDNSEPSYTDFPLVKLGKKYKIKIKASSKNIQLSEKEIRNLVDSLDEMILNDPHSIVNRYERAVLNGYIQNYKTALEDYDYIIAMDSEFAPAYINKGVIEAKLALMYNAFTSSQSSTFREDDQPQYSSMEYDLNSIQENFMQARELLPELPYAYYNLANIYCKQLQYKQGFEYYDKAIEINPNLGEAYYNKGITMIYLGDSDNGCYYVSKAGELGIEEAYAVLKRYCNKN